MSPELRHDHYANPQTQSWDPPPAEKEGRNRCTKDGQVHFFNRQTQTLESREGLPRGVRVYKEVSMYYYDRVFWVVPFDATRPAGGEWITWKRLTFCYEPNFSLVSCAGQQQYLSYQRPDQQWAHNLLPMGYHASRDYHTQQPNYGGMAGHLGLLIGLMAYTAHPNNVGETLRYCMWGQRWRTLQPQLGGCELDFRLDAHATINHSLDLQGETSAV